jgi:ribonuclease HI
MIKQLKKRKHQLLIYTDGSRLEDGNTGAGAAFYPRLCRNIAINTGPEHEVYDAELVAATTALNLARTHILRSDSHLTDIWLFLDNAAAITRMEDIKPGPGQHHALITHDIAKDLKCMGIQLHIHWVPGHTDVRGNERADKLAKRAAQKPSPSFPITSISWLKRQARGQLLQDWINHWANDTLVKGKQYDGHPKLRMDGLYYTNPRKATSALVQLRTGHGPYRSYLHRIKAPHINTPQCHCSTAIQTPEHLLLKCKTFEPQRRKLHYHPIDMKNALFSRWEMERTMEFLKMTGIGFKRWLTEEREEEDWEDRRWWGHGVGQGILDGEEENEEEE